MEGPARPSINHYLHEEVEKPQRQNANHLWLCFQRNVQGSMMPHTENDTHHGKIYLSGRWFQPRTSTDLHGNAEYISFYSVLFREVQWSKHNRRKMYFSGRWFQPRMSTDGHGNAEYISLVLCSSVRFSGRNITTEKYILVGDDSNHGRARIGTETRRIYPFIQWCSVRFSGRNITAERYILVVDITNHGRARMNTETRNMYSLVLCSSVKFSGRNITTERCSSVGDITNHGRARMNTETRSLFWTMKIINYKL